LAVWAAGLFIAWLTVAHPLLLDMWVIFMVISAAVVARRSWGWGARIVVVSR
jgi:hypothetical protein